MVLPLHERMVSIRADASELLEVYSYVSRRSVTRVSIRADASELLEGKPQTLKGKSC